MPEQDRPDKQAWQQRLAKAEAIITQRLLEGKTVSGETETGLYTMGLTPKMNQLVNAEITREKGQSPTLTITILHADEAGGIGTIQDELQFHNLPPVDTPALIDLVNHVRDNLSEKRLELMQEEIFAIITSQKD